jgi:hypothetical protein
VTPSEVPALRGDHAVRRCPQLSEGGYAEHHWCVGARFASRTEAAQVRVMMPVASNRAATELILVRHVAAEPGTHVSRPPRRSNRIDCERLASATGETRSSKWIGIRPRSERGSAARCVVERLAESSFQWRVVALLEQCVDCVGRQSPVQRIKDGFLAE